MAYPRELNLDPETEQRLISYLNEQLANHYAERQEHIDDLLRWQKDYWAKPTTEEATFPFQGAATLVIPLNAIAVEAIYARVMTTRFALPQLVSSHAVDPDWEAVDAPYERFFNRELMDVMKVRRTFGNCFLEGIKFGTMIGKVGYEKQVRTSVRINEAGEEEEFDVIVKNGAEFSAVSDARFLMPHGAYDPQTAPWCGEEHSKTPYEVMMLEWGGMFREGTIVNKSGYENDPTKQSKLWSWINRTQASDVSGGNKFEAGQEELEKTKPQWPQRIDWKEINLAFDVDGSGRFKEIKVHYHHDSQTIMSCRYNWWRDLRREYRTNVYMPIEHRWRGLGVCKINEQFQKEVTVQHRQRIDNATLANMRMIVISKLSQYGPNEPVFPGKMWFVDDMSHINTLQLGEVYPSSFNNEQATLIYSQQRTGIGELQLGQGQVGTPGTATSDLARIQEGNKKFDFIYANINEFCSEIITDVADVIQQFGPRQLAYYNTAEDGKMVKAYFDQPASYVRDGLLIDLKPSTQQHNRILDRQNWVQIAPLLQQYYTGLIQLIQLGQIPQVGQIVVMKGINAATEAMRQILESYDVRNIDRIIVKDIENMVQNGLRQLGTRQPGQDQSTTPSEIPGMDQLTQLISAGGQNGNGIPNRV